MKSIRLPIDTGKTPHLMLALVQVFEDDREPITILPLFTRERITTLHISLEIARLRESIVEGRKFIADCERINAPDSIAQMKRETIAERQTDIETCQMLIETVGRFWRELEAEEKSLQHELDELNAQLEEMPT
jgi:predicted RNase H-like nuclease (RuvC/YqgF family)